MAAAFKKLWYVAIILHVWSGKMLFAMGLMLDSAWNVAGALTGTQFELLCFRHFRRSSTPTALRETIQDYHAESTGEEPCPFKLLFTADGSKIKDLDSEDSLNKLGTFPGEGNLQHCIPAKFPTWKSSNQIY